MRAENSNPTGAFRGKGGTLILESLGGNTVGTMDPCLVSTKQQRIAEIARQSPDAVFCSLAYHIDLSWLKEAYDRVNKGKSTGVDGVTAQM